MTYYRAIVSGTFGDGDIWQWGVGIEDTGLSTTQDVADDFGTAVADNATQLRGQLRTSDVMSNVTVYRLPTIGGPSSEVAEFSLNLAGTTASGAALPNQCALVVSLRSGFPGRSKRGRCFLPIRSTGSITTSGRLNSTAATNIAQAMADMFSDFNNSLSGRRVVVLSTVQQDAYNITSVDVGDVIDTQRRRRSDLGENRYTASVSAL